MNARMIDHEEAIRNMIAERYLLGELTESDRDAYEEHLFSCPVCFEQVKAGTEFVGHLRHLVTEDPTPAVAPGFIGKLAANAAQPLTIGLLTVLICISSVSTYQFKLIRQMKAPEVVSTITVPPASRSTGTVITPSRNGSFELRIVFTPVQELNNYKAQVINASGKEITKVSIVEPQPDGIQVRFNAGTFHDGKYVLIVQGVERATGNTRNIEQYPFELQLKD
jgi:hypothetical protein